MTLTLDYVLQFIIWLFLGGMVISYLTKRQHVRILGKKRERWSLFAAILLVVPLIYWCATRSIWIGDTSGYYDKFNAAPTSIGEISDYANSFSKDNTFYAFSALIKCILGSDSQIYFAVIACIQLLTLAVIYRKYSRNYWLSIFLFVASTDYTAWMFNGMRQFLAAAISFAAAGLVFRKKYLPAMLVIYFASLFHQSALLLLPVIFLVQGEAWNRKTNLVLVFAMVCVLFVGEFTSFLDGAMADTQYKNVVSDFTNSEDDGTNALRVLVYAVPTILAFVYRRKVQEADNSMINVCVNMSIVSTGVYIVSMFTSGIFLGRLPIYMSLYNYILLPWEIRHFFKKDMRMFMTVALIGFYLMFFLYSYM